MARHSRVLLFSLSRDLTTLPLCVWSFAGARREFSGQLQLSGRVWYSRCNSIAGSLCGIHSHDGTRQVCVGDPCRAATPSRWTQILTLLWCNSTGSPVPHTRTDSRGLVSRPELRGAVGLRQPHVCDRHFLFGNEHFFSIDSNMCLVLCRVVRCLLGAPTCVRCVHMLLRVCDDGCRE